MLQQVGRYQLIELLGRGAMGEVYLALDPDLHREVAIKLISQVGQSTTTAHTQRFRREVQAAARLNHPHIVTIYDVGLEHEPPYVVMELMTGETLETVLHGKRFPWHEALTMLRPLCQALAHAHDAGIVHRDVKPANVLFAADPSHTLKLADFGLAQWADAERLTDSGGIVGTIAYMSPEQANGETADTRADIFALGLILHEAITGANPLRGDSLSETMARVTSYEPIDLSPLAEQAPVQVIEMLRRTLARDRRERYASAHELAEAMTQALNQRHLLPEAPDTAAAPNMKLKIERPPDLLLPPQAEALLPVMFASYGRLSIKEQLSGGFSGSHLLLVRPIRHDGTPELPVVVKLAPLHLIQQEWRAYQTYVRSQLAGIAEIQSQPALLADNGWGGLRYPLVGGGDFAITTLRGYYRQASIPDLRYVLEQRLFRRMGPKWRYNFPIAEFRLGDSYDLLLPVNLLIAPSPPPMEATVRVLRPERGEQPVCQPGDYVHVQGFVVTEVDTAHQAITLNRATSPQPRFYPSYRLRLQPVDDVTVYQAGQVVEIGGLVTHTRRELLFGYARALFGPDFPVTADEVVLPEGSSLPNPLARLPVILAESLTVKTANIHGDFNLGNIIVDPASRDVSLIDFALARHDHALHDLLRLETEIVTHLLPETLFTAGLPPTAVCTLYYQLHQATAHEKGTAISLPVHPALEKPLAVLTVVRQTARACLFDPDDWTEYYQGLTLYLLSTLKLRNLNVEARQGAFWAAAVCQQLLSEPELVVETAVTFPTPAAKPGRARRLTIGIMMALVFSLLLLVAVMIRWNQTPEEAAKPVAALIDFTQPVEIKGSKNGRLQSAAFGLPLYDGDVVITYAHAMARILCNNGLLIEMPAENNLVVSCQHNQDPRIIGELAPKLTPVAIALPEQTRQSSAVPVDPLSTPLLLNPRNTWIVETRPTFSWQPVAGVENYRLTVNLESGESWQRETDLTSLPYPDDAPPLRPGSVNEVIVETIGAVSAMDKSTLQVLDSTSAANLALTEAEIQGQALEAESEAFLFAQIYQQSGLFSAAIEQLQALTAGPRRDSPYVWQKLGELYFAVGLYAQGEASYQAALTAAEAIAAASAPSDMTPAATPTRTLQPAPTPTSTATMIVPTSEAALPVGLGTPVPQPQTPINPTNAGRITALAYWEQPQLSEIACSGNGRFLAAATSRGVYLYDLQSLTEERFLSVPAYVNSVAFSPDGQTMATGSNDALIRLWRVSDGTLLDTLAGHADSVWNVAFSPDGQTLASASLDHTVRLWQVNGGTQTTSLQAHTGPVRSVTFSPDGQMLASAADDQTVRLWQTAEGAELHVLRGHDDRVRSVAFSPDGESLATASDDGTVRLWQVSDGEQLVTLGGHTRPVHSVAFSPDGQTLASGAEDTNVHLWQTTDGQQLALLREPFAWVLSVVFCDNGRFLASGSSDGAIYLWGAPE